MFRRSQPGVETATATKTSVAQPLRVMNDLLRPADWDGLSDADRAQLTAQFPALGERAARGEELLRVAPPEPLQNWIAAVVGRYFQPQVAAAVRSWLDTAPETAHLFVGGSEVQGVPQLVVAAAREKVARWPAPSSYCYVPNPEAPDQAPLLLTLPLGKADAFGQALGEALNAVRQAWANPANRAPAVATNFDALISAAPPEGQAYLARLRAVLLQLAASGSDFPWDGRDNAPPVASVTPEPKDGAQVVDATGPEQDLNSALLRANGGVLVVSDSIDFKGLMRALFQRELSLQDGWPAVPLSVRVILLGDDDDYGNIPDAVFRYEAWAQDIVHWDRNAEATYAALSTGVAAYYALPAPSAGAVARLIQEGSRRADSINRTRLTTNLLLLHDLIVEAGKLTRMRNETAIAPETIDAVLEQRRALQRFNIDYVQEAIVTGENITPTSGTAVGQINGLAILAAHPWEAIFAIPCRISATVAPGEGEHVLDVEREAGQTDESHVRGLLAMEGYFIGQYGQDFSLSLAARIRFEQEQNSMGGDSASAAELFALLSALANLPMRRSIAVTGAVGQYGEIQPIGGVNFKIQGFWDLCRIRRQQGEQPEGGYGVIIPAANVRDLMLRPAVAASIANEGWFSVWPVSTVDEALPLLMGVPAATVHERAEQRLRHYAQLQAQSRRR